MAKKKTKLPENEVPTKELKNEETQDLSSTSEDSSAPIDTDPGDEQPEDKYNVTVESDPNFDSEEMPQSNAPDPNAEVKAFKPEWKELTFARVFPSEEDTIEVLTDKEYGGAHKYRMKKCKGFENGETVYVDETAEIEFVQKNSDGEVIPGLQSEQLVLALIDRHQKLHSRFPSPYTHQMLQGLNMFLEASHQRVHDRIGRGVMGNLKK